MDAFAEIIIKLDLDYRVLIPKSAMDKLIATRKSIPRQQLRKALLEYDRTVRFLLLEKFPTEYNDYCDKMRNIFSKKPNAIQDFHSIFEAICNKDIFNSIFKTESEKACAQLAFEHLEQAFKVYEHAYRDDQHHVEIKNAVDANIAQLDSDKVLLELAQIEQKKHGEVDPEDTLKITDLKRKIKDENDKWRAEEKKHKQKHFNLIPEFRLYKHLKRDSFEILLNLNGEEQSEFEKYLLTPKINIDLSQICDKDKINLTLLTDVCKKFFALLCCFRPSFYDIISEKDDTFYYNVSYKKKLSSIQKKYKRQTEFKEFMQNQHRLYRRELLKMVLCYTLDYITENTGIKFDRAVIFKSFDEVTAQETIFNPLKMPEALFNVAMQYAWEQIQDSINHSSQPSPLLISQQQEQNSAIDLLPKLSLEEEPKKKGVAVEQIQNRISHSSKSSPLFFSPQGEQEQVEKISATSNPRPAPRSTPGHL